MNTFDYKNIQIIDFLTEKGYQPTAKKGANWWYLSPLHNERTASFKVDVNKNVWYDFGLSKGGNIITLASLLYHTDDFSNLIRQIGSIKVANHLVCHTLQKESPTFANIVADDLCNPALFDYLASRGISKDIAVRYCKEVHYTCNDKRYFAIGFPNRAGGFELRNPYFKGCIAPKDITIIKNGYEVCHVFEGFIDFLSFIALHGDCYAVILNSIVNTPKAIEVLNKYEQVFCHLDNDEAGRNTTRQIITSCNNDVKDTSKEYADSKDLNEYLCKIIKEEQHG